METIYEARLYLNYYFYVQSQDFHTPKGLQNNISIFVTTQRDLVLRK
jgi:hypothetical protein